MRNLEFRSYSFGLLPFRSLDTFLPQSTTTDFFAVGQNCKKDWLLKNQANPVDVISLKNPVSVRKYFS
jgi:hypothetical protein